MRSRRLDNIKAILTLLVVYGHFLELNKDIISNGIYLFIYSFHMPAFVFCSGLVAKYSPKKAAAGILYPYFVFQTLYIFVFKDKFTYLTPYWIMWYLPALYVWRLTLGFVNTRKRAVYAFFIGLVLCFAVGFVKGISYFLSLSRIICFYPFFIAGHAIAKYRMRGAVLFAKKYRIFIFAALLACVGIMMLIAACGAMYEKNFYYAKPYRSTADLFFRILLVFMAFCAMLLFLTSVKNKKYFYTALGSRSLAVYLLHGFIVEYLRGRVLFYEPFAPLAAAVITTLLLSSGMVTKLSRPFMKLDLGRKNGNKNKR